MPRFNTNEYWESHHLNIRFEEWEDHSYLTMYLFLNETPPEIPADLPPIDQISFRCNKSAPYSGLGLKILSKFPNLQRLSIESDLDNSSSCNVTIENSPDLDLSFLKGHDYLKWLQLFRFNLKNQKFLQNLTELECVIITNCNLHTIPRFAEKNNMKKLILTSNLIENIDNLVNLSKLQKLSLEHNQIESLDHFPELRELQVLRLSHNKIAKINTILILPALRELYLTDNKLHSLWGIPNEFLNRWSKKPKTGEYRFFFEMNSLVFQRPKQRSEKYKEYHQSKWKKYPQYWKNLFMRSTIELAIQYARHETLSQLEKERLMWEGGYQELRILEQTRLTTDRIVKNIQERLQITLNMDFNILK
jgi:hypothetical protein